MDSTKTAQKDQRLADIASRLVLHHHLPAMGISVVNSQGLQAVGVAGRRKADDPTPVTIEDQWHLGSCTKMMTAVVAAHVVESGILRWDTPTSQLATKGQTPSIEWESITLDHLLCHRAGLEPDLVWPTLKSRAEATSQILSSPPPLPVGAFAYSNIGYVLAAALCEQETGRTWESLLSQEVWNPLQIAHAGFGGMGTHGQIDQPWGHTEDGKVAGNGPESDNPPILGPAGRAHMSLSDWGRFIVDQLRGARGEKGLLTAESYLHLHSPWPDGDKERGYDLARGWGVAGRPWAKGLAYSHSGSNTLHYSVVWMAPAINFAVLVTTNQGGADEACDQAASATIAAFVSE
jgi:CubicO group peptidase (beta-lactamase class C family)